MANMIFSAAAGNSEALDAIKAVSQQMSMAPGDFSRVPEAMDLMVAGERRVEVLCRDMGTAGVNLVQTVLEELKKLEV